MRKLLYGVADSTKGNFRAKDSQIYLTWSNMIRRCYCKKNQIKKPTYAGCVVDDRFLKFQVFEAWASLQPGASLGWQLDKDILRKGNRTYSPELCCFVPGEINILFTNSRAKRGKWPVGVVKDKRREGFRAGCSINGKHILAYKFPTPEDAFAHYKEMKEENIKRVAEKYREVLDTQVYLALINYQVEITD